VEIRNWPGRAKEDARLLAEKLPFAELRDGKFRQHGKRRLNFASFTTKERLNFPVDTHYHVDIITHTKFLTGKFKADWWQILKAAFQLTDIYCTNIYPQD